MNLRKAAFRLLFFTLFLLLIAWVGLKLMQYGGDFERLLRVGEAALRPLLRKGEEALRPLLDRVGPMLEDLSERVNAALEDMIGR